MLLKSKTAPWTLQLPHDLIAYLQHPHHPLISLNETATKHSSMTLYGSAPHFFNPAAEAKCWSLGQKPVLVLFFTLCSHPKAHCQHSPQHSPYTTQLRWEGFSLLPSSKTAKCFLLDQRRSKLANHTTNAAMACQLPRVAVCMLPANHRCNLLLQAELSIIPDINHQAWTKGLP